MKQRLREAALAIVVLSYMIAVYAYGSMPVRMATHWDATGSVNGYMGRIWGVAVVPLTMTAIALLMMALPAIDPLARGDQRLREKSDGILVAIELFLLYLFLLMIAWNGGVRFSWVAAVIPAMAGLFWYLGALMERLGRNWFIGIRTPWTLSSDAVWEKTHVLGGRLFKWSALVALFGLLVPQYAFGLTIGGAVMSMAIAVVYSYVIYKRERSGGL